MIKVLKKNDRLLLIYNPDDFNREPWIEERLETDGEINLRNTFRFKSNDLIDQTKLANPVESGGSIFKLGTVDGSYFRVPKSILGLKYDLLLDQSMKLNLQIFIANKNISIFRKIDELVNEPIIIGGAKEGAIPLDDFKYLQKTFPTTTEIKHYAGSRISRVLKNYLGTISDAEVKLNNYLEKKKSIDLTSRNTILESFELQKFEYIQSEVESMLNDVESYSEGDWQKKILEILLFIFPKYIAVLDNIHIKDFYSSPGKTTNRYIDLLLVDSNGNIDIIEVKKPFTHALLSRNTYRDNYTPRIELSGSVMQAEKYIFHLSKWGREGEKKILEKRKSELPEGIELKITNPKAIILIGRDKDFSDEQHFDFEIIRRKYANVVDIITYDDLLRRIENIILMMKKKSKST